MSSNTLPSFMISLGKIGTENKKKQINIKKQQKWVKDNSNVPKFMISLGKIAKENLMDSIKLKKNQNKIKKIRMKSYKSLLKEVKRCEIEERKIMKQARKVRREFKEQVKNNKIKI